LEIAYLQFVFRRLTLAVCSRIRRDGSVEIEIGLGDPRLPKSAFTADQMRLAEANVPHAARRATSRPARPDPLISCAGGGQRASVAALTFAVATLGINVVAISSRRRSTSPTSSRA
jgi:hypothetical protein